MNILYISQTVLNLNDINIYSDLINELKSRGHNVTAVFADAKCERTQMLTENDCKVIKVKVGNQFGVNIIKKALVILTLETKLKNAIKKYLKDEHFDLVLYATPPITLANVIKYSKKKFNCKSYLMLKDIFPQNAVDIGMLKKTGLKGFIYKHFRKKEMQLYNLSDKIGCMSEGNVQYLLKENPYLDKDKVEIFPNASIIRQLENKDKSILEKYGIDSNKLIFLYGGNLGKPQGLEKYALALKQCENMEDICFVNIGKGSEKEKFFESVKDLKNVVNLDYLPTKDYDDLCRACDIGVVLLDYRFTIPNFPSRTLSYLHNEMPILAFTDNNTDYKDFVMDNNIGKWACSDNIDGFVECVKWFNENREKLLELKNNARRVLIEQFNVKDCADKLEKFIAKEEN